MLLDVLVVGSLNDDLTIPVDQHPSIGETVLGGDYIRTPGGKGANQAVAIARLGGATGMIGAVGNDASGKHLIDNLRVNGVDVSGIEQYMTAPTGIAVITVDRNGENSIVVSPGANLQLQPPELIPASRVLLAQLEIPIATVVAVAALSEAVFCLNPAPAQQLPPSLMAKVDVLIPNRAELATLAGVSEPTSISEVADAASRISGPDVIVVTLGSDGAALIEGGKVTEVPAPKVEVLDTTGAGDAFCGAFAYGLSQGFSLFEATKTAVAAGAIATTKVGAQAASPTATQLKAFLGS